MTKSHLENAKDNQCSEVEGEHLTITGGAGEHLQGFVALTLLTIFGDKNEYSKRNALF